MKVHQAITVPYFTYTYRYEVEQKIWKDLGTGNCV